MGDFSTACDSAPVVAEILCCAKSPMDESLYSDQLVALGNKGVSSVRQSFPLLHRIGDKTSVNACLLDSTGVDGRTSHCLNTFGSLWVVFYVIDGGLQLIQRELVERRRG